MSVPKSVMKIDRKGVIYTSSVDRASYTILELTRAALRDVGRYLARTMRSKARKLPGSQRDRFVRYKTAGFIFKVPWAESGLPHLEVGVTPDSWYTEEHERGSSDQPRRGILRDTAYANIAKIVEIESKYLSALEDEAEALRLIQEGEYSGGAD